MIKLRKRNLHLTPPTGVNYICFLHFIITYLNILKYIENILFAVIGILLDTLLFERHFYFSLNTITVDLWNLYTGLRTPVEHPLQIPLISAGIHEHLIL